MLKLKNIKKVAGETKCLKGYYHGGYLQLNYNKKTHELFTVYFYSLGHNSWVVYHDDNIVTIGNISEPMTMQEIYDMVERWLIEYEWRQKNQKWI